MRFSFNKFNIENRRDYRFFELQLFLCNFFIINRHNTILQPSINDRFDFFLRVYNEIYVRQTNDGSKIK